MMFFTEESFTPVRLPISVAPTPSARNRSIVRTVSSGTLLRARLPSACLVRQFVPTPLFAAAALIAALRSGRRNEARKPLLTASLYSAFACIVAIRNNIASRITGSANARLAVSLRLFLNSGVAIVARILSCRDLTSDGDNCFIRSEIAAHSAGLRLTPAHVPATLAMLKAGLNVSK